MKKFLEEKHDLLAGIFASIAVIAIVCEIVWSGSTKESIVTGIKDVSGLLIDVLVLVVAASVLIRKPINFKDKFNEAMMALNSKYDPLLTVDKKTENSEKDFIRYNIASNSDALFSGTAKSPERIFQLAKEKPEEICFYINKSFFNQKGGVDFEPSSIANEIKSRLTSTYSNFKYSTNPNGNNYELHIKFNKTLETNDDIDMLIELIDYTILLFIARNRS